MTRVRSGPLGRSGVSAGGRLAVPYLPAATRLAKDPWMQFAFGPFLLHSGMMRGAAWWTTRLREAGFEIIEDGMRPATLYVLARKSSSSAMK